jgi:Fic family protein
MIPYKVPENWMRYDPFAVIQQLATAKAAVLSLTSIPVQRDWADQMQIVQLKREVAGTSRIEGADFTDKELDAAINKSPDPLFTRSQLQASATVKAYRWIATLPTDRPIDAELIREVHRLIIAGADDDHCPPGELRSHDQNVTFGNPRHRGVEGGSDCETAFAQLCRALQQEFKEHDPLIQSLALHYHFAAMHPFLDGNGRTARALEALMLQRTGLKDTLFIAMSNYYYEERTAYLAALAQVRAADHDLTPFLLFGLRGIELQCSRLFSEIRINLSKALFRNVMYDLFNHLFTKRKRVLAERQLKILKHLLERELELAEIREKTSAIYASLHNPEKALIRDINYLIQLRTIDYQKLDTGKYLFSVRLQWPTEITETEFYKRAQKMPKAKTHSFL